MKLSTLIKELEKIKEHDGECEVYTRYVNGSEGKIERIILHKNYSTNENKLSLYPSAETSL